MIEANSLERRLRRHLHAPVHPWFAPCAPGLDEVLAQELLDLGAQAVCSEPGGVSFQGRLETGYRANLWLRTANRVLLRIATFGAHRPEDLFRHVSRLSWELFLNPTIPLRTTSHSERSWLSHEDLVERTLREAIARRWVDVGGDGSWAQVRGTAEQEEQGGAIQRLLVRVVEDQVQLSLDSSGAHLHRRGYRLDSAKAPMRETLAAGVLGVAGYRGGILHDPMCGSGTLVIEGAMIARQQAPGAQRAFLFQHWPSFKPNTWQHLLTQERAGRREAGLPDLIGGDRDPAALRAARANAARAGVGPAVHLEESDFFEAAPPPGPGWVVLNPPYGLRLEDPRATASLFARIGDRLRQTHAGWRYGILVPSPDLIEALRLPVARRLRLPHGGLTIELVTGEIPADDHALRLGGRV